MFGFYHKKKENLWCMSEHMFKELLDKTTISNAEIIQNDEEKLLIEFTASNGLKKERYKMYKTPQRLYYKIELLNEKGADVLHVKHLRDEQSMHLYNFLKNTKSFRLLSVVGEL